MLVHAVLVQHTSACNMQAKAGPAVGRFGHIYIYIIVYYIILYLSVNLCFLSALIVYTHKRCAHVLHGP